MIKKQLEKIIGLIKKQFKSEKKTRGYILFEFIIYIGIAAGIITVIYKVALPKIDRYMIRYEVQIYYSNSDAKDFNYIEIENQEITLKNKYKKYQADLEEIKKDHQ